MGLLARAEVTPLYGQVELRDGSSDDYPEWQTGEEAVVALPRCVAVATQGDLSGKVSIEVWEGRIDRAEATMTPSLYEGEFTVTDGVAKIGNTVANEFVSFRVPAQWSRVNVFTAPAGEPARIVYFILTLGR
jgi:hypothetical protein